MRQQGQYSDSGLGSYSVSQMHQVPSQRMEQSHPDPFEGRLEAFTPERENSYLASKNEDQWRWERDESKMPNSMASHMFNEGQGGDLRRSYFQGQRPNPKLVLEKGSNSDLRFQSHGKNMESRFGDGLLPQNFDGLEQKFIDDIINFSKEQNDAEDEENARHRERIIAINSQYEEQLAALRAQHAGRRDELLRRESSARHHQYQKGIRDHYPNGGIGPENELGFLGILCGILIWIRVYDTGSRLGSNGNITWHVSTYPLPPDLDQQLQYGGLTFLSLFFCVIIINDIC